MNRQIRLMAKSCKAGNIKRLTAATYHLALGKYEQYFKEKYLNKSYSLDRLREALGLDVNISIKDLLLYTFGLYQKSKTKMN